MRRRVPECNPRRPWQSRIVDEVSDQTIVGIGAGLTWVKLDSSRLRTSIPPRDAVVRRR